MSANNDNIHSGHRSRVRERINNGGLETMHNHEILEYLLFHTVPYKDTNPLAHKLIQHFGSFHAVMDASYDDLMLVSGVSDVTATFLTSLPTVFRKYSEDIMDCSTISSSEDIVKFMTYKFAGCTKERVYLLSLDKGLNIKNCSMISEGQTGEIVLEKRKVMEVAIRNNADVVILVHNHPNMIVTPSSNDIESTFVILRMLAGVGIRLIDHIVIAGNNYFSMAKDPKLMHMFKQKFKD